MRLVTADSTWLPAARCLRELASFMQDQNDSDHILLHLLECFPAVSPRNPFFRRGVAVAVCLWFLDVLRGVVQLLDFFVRGGGKGWGGWIPRYAVLK